MGKLKLNPDTVQVQTLEMPVAPSLSAAPAASGTYKAALGCRPCVTSQAVCF
ncbi:MAG TPA: hypothetical protein VFJ16_12490 [Longimicrobium sp.]|nr:hypothetical protein [Longimicrobium sp.]